MMRCALIILAFGSSRKEAYTATLEPLKNILEHKYSIPVYIVFTSDIIRKKLKECDMNIYSLQGAIDDIRLRRIEKIYIQPYNMFSLLDEGLLKKKTEHENIVMGLPVLPKDEKKVVEKINDILLSYDSDYNKTWVLVAHGSKKTNNDIFYKLQNSLNNKGFKNLVIGTLEGEPSIYSLIKDLKTKKTKDINLMALMMMPGIHVMKHMAGEEENSWKSILVSNGFNVRVITKSLGEDKKFMSLWMEKIDDLLK